jgi:hypothetical protein
MRGIRSCGLPYSRLKGMGFGDRKRVAVNEFNSSTHSIVVRSITLLKVMSEFTNT